MNMYIHVEMTRIVREMARRKASKKTIYVHVEMKRKDAGIKSRQGEKPSQGLKRKQS
jgi:hypothetical protein